MFESWDLGKVGCSGEVICVAGVQGVCWSRLERFGGNREKGQWMCGKLIWGVS